MYSSIKVDQKYLVRFIQVGCATCSLYAGSGPKAEGVPNNNQRGRENMQRLSGEYNSHHMLSLLSASFFPINTLVL